MVFVSAIPPEEDGPSLGQFLTMIFGLWVVTLSHISQESGMWAGSRIKLHLRSLDNFFSHKKIWLVWCQCCSSYAEVKENCGVDKRYWYLLTQMLWVGKTVHKWMWLAIALRLNYTNHTFSYNFIWSCLSPYSEDTVSFIVYKMGITIIMLIK